MGFTRLRKIKYTLFILFVLCLVTVFYLTSVGLPRTIVLKIEPYLQFRGMVFNMDRIKLSIFEGIVATKVKYYKIGDVGEPVVQADKFVLKLEPLAWIRGGSGVSGAIIKNGRVQFSPDGNAAGKVVFDNIYADVIFDSPPAGSASSSGLPAASGAQQPRAGAGRSRLKILSFATAFSGAKVSGKGTIVLPSEEEIPAESSMRSPDLANISSRLKDFASSNAVNIDVDFYVDPDNIEKLSVKADIHGRNTAYGGVVIGAWSANISINGKSAAGNIALKDAEFEKLAFPSVNVILQFDGKSLITASLKSMVAGETQTGPLALQVNYNFSSDQFEGHATTGCDLRAFVPLLKSFELKLADIFAAFDFKRSLPSGDIRFKGGLKPEFSCRITGEVLTDSLAFKRVSCLLIKVGFDAELFETGEKVTIRPLLVVRDEGLARGQFVYNSAGKTITFSGMSMADPKAIAAMIDPLVASALDPYSFDGLCYITAFGTVGYADSAPNDAEISFNANDVRWKMLKFASCALTLSVLEESYKIDDFNGSICRGVINGLGSVDPAAGSSNMVFTVSAKADNVDFGVLINSMSGRQIESAYEGLCSGSVNLQGLIEDPNGSSIKGNGWIKIEHGRIFTVPIFSGLFDILGKVIPGMGPFNGKNNAEATITVENGKVHGRNIYIDGDVFSLKGAGDVYFDGRLDFKVQVTFMRRNSLVGSLVQIITAPLTKACEFHLGGTVSNPKWEASYWPF